MDKKRRVPSNDIVAILQILSALFMIIFFIRIYKLHIYYYRKLSFMDQNSLDGKIVVPQLAEEAGTLIFLKLLK